MSMPSPPPPRSGLGPPPSLDGLSALLSREPQKPNGSDSTRSPSKQATPLPSASKRQSQGVPIASSSSTTSSLLSPNHPTNLRKQAKTQLDPTFSIKSYVGAANALLEKARSSDAQGQAEQAFVNYLKAADVATNIPKHADWAKVVQQKGPTYYRYTDFMKNVPDIIQRGHRLEELLKAREDARAQEVQKSLEEEKQHQRQTSYVEEDLVGVVGGTDAQAPSDDPSSIALAERLGALRVNGYSSDSLMNAKRMSQNIGRIIPTHGTSQDGIPSEASTSRLPTQPDGSPPRAVPEDFASSYPTLDDFESRHQAGGRDETGRSTPSRPLPVAPVGLSESIRLSKTAPPPTTRQEVSVEELFPWLNPGFDTVEDRERGTMKMVRRSAPRVLLLDVRSRSEWEARRIKGVDSVCIDPPMLREGASIDAITAALQTNASSTERRYFEDRHLYDYVVLCDYDSRTISEPLDVLYRAVCQGDSRRPLKHSPRFLVGGVNRWAKKVGDIGLVGTAASVGSTTPRDGSGPESPSTKNKRQGMYLSGLPPAVLTPGGGYDRAAGGFDHPSGPSIPARAYAASNAVTSGLPTAPSHAHQPHIPSYHASPSSSSQSISGSFDYPQLAYQTSQQRQSPYAMPTNGTTAPKPPPAAVAGPNGYGYRAPPLLDSSGRQSSDVARRSAVPPPGGAPMLSTQGRQLSYQSQQPERSSQVRIGMTGLKNVGNSCYMNSTLQCLNATIPLARFLLDGSYRKAINRVNPLGTQGALAEAFAQLIRVMWSEQYTFVSPVTFREAITRFAPAFRGYEQHDAQEFLAFLLDGLHEDLNYVKQKPPAVEMTAAREEELETLPQQIASVQEWSIYRERNDSLVVDWFQGQFRNKLTCLTCGKTSTTYNAFLYLSLPIPTTSRGGKVTLAQCLDAFTKDEILDKADAWNCPRCKKPRRATKKLTISRLPQILLIHLKRFSFKGPFTDKIETLVQFPTTNLDLTNYMPPPLPPGAAPKGTPTGPFVYDLYAATHHFGSLSGGHYTATIRTQGERGEPQWMYCDDSRITKSDDGQIHSPSSYILWWNRKGR